MKTPQDVARQITEKIAHSSFKIFKDRKFRQLVDFDNLEQTEQDRIFNELVVTGLSLAILMFRTLAELTKDEASNYYSELQVETKSRYGNWLRELGVENEFTNLWKELIEMRCKEYQKNFQDYQKQLPRPQESNPWIPVVAIGGYTHIRRGKTKQEDPLFLPIVRWVKELAITISKTLGII